MTNYMADLVSPLAQTLAEGIAKSALRTRSLQPVKHMTKAHKQIFSVCSPATRAGTEMNVPNITRIQGNLWYQERPTTKSITLCPRPMSR
jgi:hypothetical protein